ncbi:MAG TPA: Ni/Fe hydrogenase subunit alpha [Thermodesulfobacteriota bacterium]|nr:Ni/Fe hydrogenase subunit alpha [Thermodesulfobacteriota bacterium]
MHKDHNINIHEITRVEGHGNIVIDVKNGVIKELKLEIIESPRFFEAMLVGRRYDEAQHIMSRICGICAVSHTSASLKAVESAMGMTISAQSRWLRELAFAGETLQSHILHLYFLVLPDFLGQGSILPLIKSHPKAAKLGLNLKNLANEICRIVGGRHIHPISLWPGGVLHTPKKTELRQLKTRLVSSLAMLEETIEMFAGFKVREFKKDREYVSLKAKKGYALYDGIPYSSESGGIGADEYARAVKEFMVPHSAAKHARTKRGTYMVGALARLNNNFNRLSPRARAVAEKLGVTAQSNNPFLNNQAQLVECVHVTEDAAAIVEKLLATGLKEENPVKPKTCGRGVGIVEAPRGTLFHEYTINKSGLVEKANCIIPTAQNLRSMEDDLREFVPMILDKSKVEITAAIEALVRAYDPCISCSTHIMNVKFA